MFAFNNSDIAILAALCVVNLFCAGVVHRAVMLNAGCMQRRLLFEGLSLFGFVAAIALSLFSVLMWVRNPPFVLACSLVWVTLCSLAVARIWYDHRSRFNKKTIEVPELLDQRPIRSDQLAIMSGKKNGWATMTRKPETAPPPAAHPLHRSPVSDEAEVLQDRLEMSGKDVRDKLEKYNRKRAYKSAPVSNLSTYRHRSKKVLPESTTKTACK